MVDTLALEYLYDTVAASFTAEGHTAAHYFGWREPSKQLGASGARGNRIAWVPGDPSANVGSMLSAMHPGGSIDRSLGTLRELFYCEITGSDDTAPESERAQWKAARLLFDDWWRHVYTAAHSTEIGPIEVVGSVWVVDKTVRRHGATMRVVCAILAKIPDSHATEAPADVTGAMADELHDTIETVEIDP